MKNVDTTPFKFMSPAPGGFRCWFEEEIKEYVLFVLGEIEKPGRTKDENRRAWEKGWSENLKSGRTKPGYFRGSKFLRYKGDVLADTPAGLEHKLFVKARREIFKKHLSPHGTILELGCGSCQNLEALKKMFPDKNLIGYDWSHSAVMMAAEIIGEAGAWDFDMTRPTNRYKLFPGTAVLSIHALEQIGTEHERLLKWLLKNKPSLVVHYEPIYEFYNPDDLLDRLAMMYHDKRGYLKGYYPALKKLEADGKIEIIEARRPYLGGVLHEASIIVWRPK